MNKNRAIAVSVLLAYSACDSQEAGSEAELRVLFDQSLALTEEEWHRMCQCDPNRCVEADEAFAKCFYDTIFKYRREQMVDALKCTVSWKSDALECLTLNTCEELLDDPTLRFQKCFPKAEVIGALCVDLPREFKYYLFPDLSECYE